MTGERRLLLSMAFFSFEYFDPIWFKMESIFRARSFSFLLMLRKECLDAERLEELNLLPASLTFRADLFCWRLLDLVTVT